MKGQRLGHHGFVAEASSSWGSRVWASVRTAPVPLLITMSAFVLLFFATIICNMFGAAGARDVVVGAFGASTAALGLVLLSNVNSSAVAMERFADAVRSGRVSIPGGRWTARRYRLLGACYVVLGCVFAIAGWSGVIT